MDSKLSFNWWGEAVSTATYLLNRTPVSLLSFKTPFEMIFSYAPKMDHLHPCGCPVYIHVNKANLKSKLHPRAEKGFFLGYSERHKNVCVYNSTTNKIQIIHDCLFNEKFQETISSSKEESSCLDSTSFAPVNNSHSETSITDNSSPSEEIGPSLDIGNSIPSSSFQTATEFNNEVFHGLQEHYTSEDATTHQPLDPLPIKSLPKGWVMENVLDKESKDISSNLDASNILPEGQ
ncbi:hypothetical protein O181_077200 [Austropuccinia psidii MF-1]|uniref:Retroviral polymerase SH3-like domain-containing protein n=1 Tax=Austropuccinia psidii MF-1 TaxID=1389203 RepID=A0A9Q3FHJ6_9BASI|nr:hypothetical protein [Austropuccinia psidii MF-1]